MDLLTKFLEYLSLEKQYSSHTITAYQKDIQTFFTFLSLSDGVLIPNKVENKHIRNWIVDLNHKNISNRSINRKITSLKSFYKFLQKTGDVTSNPLQHQKSLKISKKVIVPFSEKEVSEAFLQQPQKSTPFEQLRNKLMIHLFYATGIRQAELINLQIHDVDFIAKTIRVLGKRNKERIVPIYQEILEELKNYLVLRNTVNSSIKSFFVTQKGDKIYNTLVYRVINSYFSKVSTKEIKSPHVLRHSYATDLVNNGADLNSVKELLGHSSLAATQVYTHNSLDQLKQVYNQAHPRGAKKNDKI